MKLSAKQNILAFLQENPTLWHGAELQKMDFKNRNGSNATGDTIKRRLNELVREGKAYSEQRDGFAYFSADPIPKRKQVVEIKNGVAHISYIEEKVDEEIKIPESW